MKKHIVRLAIATGLLWSTSSIALSPAALQGQALYPACQGCHDPALDPPQGPPMWGVQRIYKRNTLDEQDFIERMVDFVKAPTPEKALHTEAVKQLGLMQPLALPDELLTSIVTYIFEAEFPPPCEHWRIAVRRAEARGDSEHAQKDQRQLDRFCR